MRVREPDKQRWQAEAAALPARSSLWQLPARDQPQLTRGYRPVRSLTGRYHVRNE